MTTERDIIEAFVPDSVKEASRNFQMHTVMSHLTGLEDFSIEKVSAYLGGRMAARRQKWRPVTEGLLALNNLQR